MDSVGHGLEGSFEACSAKTTEACASSWLLQRLSDPVRSKAAADRPRTSRDGTSNALSTDSLSVTKSGAKEGFSWIFSAEQVSVRRLLVVDEFAGHLS